MLTFLYHKEELLSQNFDDLKFELVLNTSKYLISY